MEVAVLPVYYALLAQMDRVRLYESQDFGSIPKWRTMAWGIMTISGECARCGSFLDGVKMVGDVAKALKKGESLLNCPKCDGEKAAKKNDKITKILKIASLV